MHLKLAFESRRFLFDDVNSPIKGLSSKKVFTGNFQKLGPSQLTLMLSNSLQSLLSLSAADNLHVVTS